MVNLAHLFLIQQLRTCVLTDGVPRWFHQAGGTGGVVGALATAQPFLPGGIDDKGRPLI